MLLPWRSLKSVHARYGAALLAGAVALLLGAEWKPAFGDFALYIAAIPALCFIDWGCGLGPSSVTAACVLAGAKYWLTQPTHSLRLAATGNSHFLLAFALTSGLIMAVGEVSRRERQRLLHAHGELEERVKQRTAALDLANQGLSDLTARLLHIQDEERRRIARDLHDSIGQTLAALGLNLSTVGNEIERLTKMISLVKDSQELVRETSISTRTMSYLLHPPLLDENGLSSALPWYTKGFAERSNIHVDLDIPRDLPRLSHDSEMAVFRLVQECLTNIHRHSESPTAKIRIAPSGRDLYVMVEDHGKGIAPEKLVELASGGTSGVGVRGMRERIRQLDGTLDISSDGLGKGTVVVVRLPLVPAQLANSDPREADWESKTKPH